VAAAQAEALESNWDDIWSDLVSFRWLHFYSVPKVKFTVHFCFYFAYMFYAASILMRQDSAEGEISGYEIFFWVWALSRQIGEAYELDEFSLAGVRMYIRDFWNKLDTGTFLMIMTAAAVRINNATREEEWGGSFVDVLPRTIYALAVLLIFLRVLQLLTYQQTVGVLAIVLSAMGNDVVYFLAIFIALSVGFGVSFAVMLPMSMTEPWYRVMGTNPLWGSFWGVFFSFDVSEPLEMEMANFTADGGPLVEQLEPTTTLVPILLWIYQFVAAIILINLLIAQMADTYGRVTADGLVRWQFERAALISEYKDTKPPLPPPFNLLCVACNLLRGLLGKACDKHDESGVTPGFQTVPNTMQLRILERREQAALKQCLRQREETKKESPETKAEELRQTLAKLEDQSRSRFEKLDDQSRARFEEFEGQNTARFETIDGKISAYQALLDGVRTSILQQAPGSKPQSKSARQRRSDQTRRGSSSSPDLDELDASSPPQDHTSPRSLRILEV